MNLSAKRHHNSPSPSESGSVSAAKRLRRHVIGRVREYFAVTAPGLETLCAAELAGLPLSCRQWRVEPGGVAFAGKLEDCWLANLHLRTATRILMRIGTFKAAAFHRLEEQIARVNWELFLPARPAARVKVAVHGCRLYHSGAIAQRAAALIQARQGAVADPDPAANVAQTIYLRGLNDRFSLSIDASGDSLHRRGLKTHGAAAPIRETLAAAVLMSAGFAPGMVLADPMCGSGTFSLEGAMMGLAIPAGWFRDFAFMGWPSFVPRRWEALRRTHRPGAMDHPAALVFASDKDPDVCRRLGRCLEDHGLDRFVHLSSGDFLALAPPDRGNRSGLLVLNPPYGRRLGTTGSTKVFYESLWKRINRAWVGWHLALIGPAAHLPSPLPPGLTARSLVHGGLDLTLVFGRING